jgi:RES domain-containing protein
MTAMRRPMIATFARRRNVLRRRFSEKPADSVGSFTPRGTFGWRLREARAQLLRAGLLSVPSAIVEIERKVLLNPRHRDAGSVAVTDITPFGWDQRLFP